MTGLNADSVTTMDQRLCPFLQKPCVGAQCALWMRYDRADGHTFEACTFVLSTVLQEQGVVEQIRTQASMDKTATEIQAGFHTGARTLVALATAASRRALEDGDAHR